MAQSTKYPTRSEVHDIFAHMADGNYSETFKHISPNVDWTVMGTHPLAGHYTTLEDFQEHTIKVLNEVIQSPGILLKVRHVIGSDEGTSEWAAVELVADGVCHNDLPFQNAYSWNVRFTPLDASRGEEGKSKVVQVRAYLDSKLVEQAVVQNKLPNVQAPVDMVVNR